MARSTKRSEPASVALVGVISRAASALLFVLSALARSVGSLLSPRLPLPGLASVAATYPNVNPVIAISPGAVVLNQSITTPRSAR